MKMCDFRIKSLRDFSRLLDIQQNQVDTFSAVSDLIDERKIQNAQPCFKLATLFLHNYLQKI